MEQPQYNMLVREKFEKEYGPIFEKYGYGSTVWSPLASGVLTGRYNDGNVPEDSRWAEDPSWKDMTLGQFFSPDKRERSLKVLNELGDLAKEQGYSQIQIALAWALANKDVSTLILGFSKPHYIDENMKSLELYRKWNKELEEKVEGILGNTPNFLYSFRTFAPNKTRRQISVFEKK